MCLYSIYYVKISLTKFLLKVLDFNDEFIKVKKYNIFKVVAILYSHRVAIPI